MAKFNFIIHGSFETPDAMLALLELTHLAEITKINSNQKFKLDFTSVNISKYFEDQWGPPFSPYAVPPQPPLHQHTDQTLVSQPYNMPPFKVHEDQSGEGFEAVPISPIQTEDEDEFDIDEETTVIPQAWKDKMADEGTPTD